MADSLGMEVGLLGARILGKGVRKVEGDTEPFVATTINHDHRTHFEGFSFQGGNVQVGNENTMNADGGAGSRIGAEG